MYSQTGKQTNKTLSLHHTSTFFLAKASLEEAPRNNTTRERERMGLISNKGKYRYSDLTCCAVDFGIHLRVADGVEWVAYLEMNWEMEITI